MAKFGVNIDCCNYPGTQPISKAFPMLLVQPYLADLVFQEVYFRICYTSPIALYHLTSMHGLELFAVSKSRYFLLNVAMVPVPNQSPQLIHWSCTLFLGVLEYPNFFVRIYNILAIPSVSSVQVCEQIILLLQMGGGSNDTVKIYYRLSKKSFRMT